jgi:hypothetical protein
LWFGDEHDEKRNNKNKKPDSACVGLRAFQKFEIAALAVFFDAGILASRPQADRQIGADGKIPKVLRGVKCGGADWNSAYLSRLNAPTLAVRRDICAIYPVVPA